MTVQTTSDAAPAQGTIGYYRFTDVFFEWWVSRATPVRAPMRLTLCSQRHQALPDPEDVGPLKALIAYDALVHPDHPLRKPGVNGIELYLGEWHPAHWAANRMI